MTNTERDQLVRFFRNSFEQLVRQEANAHRFAAIRQIVQRRHDIRQAAARH